MNTMLIGSGDISRLMMGKNTDGHLSLLRQFVSGIKPYRNAKNSPVDALRTGAILEERYSLILPDDYYPQYVVQSKEMSVFKCSLDFAKIENGSIVDFEELKSLNFDDFLNVEPYRGTDIETYLPFILSKYKKYYCQIQEQLYCTEIDSANLVFLAVYSYDDSENYIRDIQENEYIKFRIPRDNNVIEAIKERGTIFQQIKDYYENSAT